ncbi:sigma-70 family RNA polymerase sigma factor [Candidatus Poribacteria bacterium]
MRTEDGHIIQKCLDGDSAAFGLLVDKYKASIYALAYSKLGNFHDAEDVSQDVFVSAYLKLRTLRRWDNFLAWLYAITSNQCKLLLRSRSRRPDQEFIEDKDTEALKVVSLDSYREKHAHGDLYESLNSLPEMYREVLTLYYLGGMSGKEIAQFLGTSPATVRQRLGRARSKLKKEMLAMMSTTFEGQKLKATFTFRIVEAVKRIKIQPTPRTGGLPWGLSLATGIIFTVLSLSPYLSFLNPMSVPAGSSLPAETKVLKTAEISVDIINTSRTQVIASNQGDGNIGGAERPDPQNALFMAPQAEEGEWTVRSEMPTARMGACSAAVDGKIYVIGGGTLDEIFPEVEEYDPATDIWKRKEDMPTGRMACSANVADGKIYVIGGAEEVGVSTPIVEEYDPATEVWERKADMPTARSSLTTNVVNGKIYAIGGMVVKTPWSVLSVVEEYDLATDAWVRKANMPTARHGAASGVVDGKIYVIGGWAGNAMSSAVEEYDPITDTWSRKSPIPTPRDFFSICELDGKLYAIGGQNSNEVFSVVEVYDPATDTWTTEPGMPTARMYLTATVANGNIYAAGGSTQKIGPNTAFAPVIGTLEEYNTKSTLPTQGKSVEATGKAIALWGAIKSD